MSTAIKRIFEEHAAAATEAASEYAALVQRMSRGAEDGALDAADVAALLRDAGKTPSDLDSDGERGDTSSAQKIVKQLEAEVDRAGHRVFVPDPRRGLEDFDKRGNRRPAPPPSDPRRLPSEIRDATFKFRSSSIIAVGGVPTRNE